MSKVRLVKGVVNALIVKGKCKFLKFLGNLADQYNTRFRHLDFEEISDAIDHIENINYIDYCRIPYLYQLWVSFFFGKWKKR